MSPSGTLLWAFHQLLFGLRRKETAVDKNLPEPLPPVAALAVASFSTLLGSGALYLLFRGLFAARFGSVLAFLAIAALGIFLLKWSARRTDQWRLAVAAVSAACGFYYVWRAEIVAESGKRWGTLDRSGALTDRLACGSTALVLFLVAGIVLGTHLLGAWRDD